ncbi:MAG: rpoE [Chthonomonadaceae bacterium]|nr:rpoE [Chthonomonadaceae bacterium]
MSDLDETKTAQQVQEERLLEKARQGDSRAARELFELYRPHVRRLLTRQAPSEEVDDLVQETMIAGWHGLPRFQGKSSLFTWLAGIARNLRSNRARAAGRVTPTISLDSADSDSAVQRDARSAPLEQVVAAQATTDLLHAAIQRECTAPQRRVLLLAFQGEALNEIGALLQMSEATVRSHYRRGRCRLLAHLLQNHSDLLGGETAIQAAWEQTCHAAEEAKRPSVQEQEAFTHRKSGDHAFCGALLKLARYLQLAAILAWIWLGVYR